MSFDHTPKRSDFGDVAHDEYKSEGSGPGLRDPNDKIQKSPRANDEHLDQVSKSGGAGPGLLNSPTSPPRAVQHVEHAYPPHGGGHDLENASTFRESSHGDSGSTYRRHRDKEEIQRESTLSTIRTYIGLPPDAPILDDHQVHTHLTWSAIRHVLREPFNEFFGVFIMIMFGNGSVAQVLLSTGQTSAPGGNGFGAYQSISWGWGLGVMLGVYVSGDSGAYLNPAVTLAFCIYRKLPWRRFPIYMLAQVLGAFCASGVVYATYIPAIDAFAGRGVRTVPPAAGATAGIFCTYPQAFLTRAGMFVSEFVASAVLLFVIFALKDDSNPGAMGKSGAGKLFPLALFFLIFGLGACFGWETGYAINLARDFGPRLMSYAVGYGPEVWSAGEYYFWIPMVAPFCGCIFGGFLYDAFIYTGPDSPLNTPWLGIKGVVTGKVFRMTKEKRPLHKGEV